MIQKASQATAFAILLLLGTTTSAQVIQVFYMDGSNFGFNDNTSVQPAPGNDATTLGGQRRAVFEAAVDIWATRLDAAVPIRVRAEWDDLGCGDGGYLGVGGTRGLTWNLSGLPPQTVYSISQASALLGNYVSGYAAEMTVTFNFRYETDDCRPHITGYWYGLDPETPPAIGTVSFLELALHELAHGLGFQSFTDRETREFLGPGTLPDVMSEFIYSIGQQRTWREISASQRRSSATSGAGLAWSGPQANLRAAERLLPPGLITTSSPIQTNSRFPAFIQGFPPYLPLEGLSAPLRLAISDNPGEPISTWDRNLACLPLTNPETIAGNIALVYRGVCNVADKLQHVFDAGGLGMILVDDRSSGDEFAIDRDRYFTLDRNLPIPFYAVTRTTGLNLRGGLGGGRIFTLGYNTLNAPRGTNQGLINLHAQADNSASNVVHFSDQMFPPSMMNPRLLSNNYDGGMDFVPDLLYDMGWPSDADKLAQYSGNWFNPGRAGEGCQLTMEMGNDIPVLTCYLYRDGKPFWLIGNGEHHGDRYEFPEMVITEGADYGSAFDPDDVLLSQWGTITMRIRDCNRARFEFRPDPEQELLPQVTEMQKVTAGDCNLAASQQIDRSRSGNYFDPERSGEGIQLARETSDNTWVMTWYTYLDGEQVWMIGSTVATGDTLNFEDLVITRGGQWGQDFDPSEVELIPFGTIEMDFIDCNRVNVKIDPTLEEFEATEREMTRVVARQC